MTNPTPQPEDMRQYFESDGSPRSADPTSPATPEEMVRKIRESSGLWHRNDFVEAVALLTQWMEAKVAEAITPWIDACQALSKEINVPEDVEGWLVSIEEVEEHYPKDILEAGYAQSPMEGLVTMRDQLADAKSKIDKLIQYEKWYLELLEEVYADEPDSQNERTDPRLVVRSLHGLVKAGNVIAKQLTAAQARIKALETACAKKDEALDHARNNMAHPDQFIDEALALTPEHCVDEIGRLKERLNFHRDMGITLLDAKWLDPECHKGCQSLIYKERAECAEAKLAQLEADKADLQRHADALAKDAAFVGETPALRAYRAARQQTKGEAK